MPRPRILCRQTAGCGNSLRIYLAATTCRGPAKSRNM